MLLENFINHLEKFDNIIVSGPQRTGTTFCSFCIADALKYKWYTEETFNVHDFKSFLDILSSKQKKVIQCPALSYNLEKIPNDEKTIIVVLRRSLEDIVKSEKRIHWADTFNLANGTAFSERLREKLKYLNKYEHLQKDEQLPEVDFTLPIAKIKYLFWDNYQKPLIKNSFDLEYEDLKKIFPDKWIDKKFRKNFHSRQISTDQGLQLGSKALNDKYAQLFIDTGKGFNEKLSIEKSLQKGENAIVFDLSGYDKIQALRIDPSNKALLLKNFTASIKTTHGLKSVNVLDDNSTYKRQSCWLFNTNDPQIILDFDKTKQLLELRVSFEILSEDASVVEVAKHLLIELSRAAEKEKQQFLANSEAKKEIILNRFKEEHEQELAYLQQSLSDQKESSAKRFEDYEQKIEVSRIGFERQVALQDKAHEKRLGEYKRELARLQQSLSDQKASLESQLSRQIETSAVQINAFELKIADFKRILSEQKMRYERQIAERECNLNQLKKEQQTEIVALKQTIFNKEQEIEQKNRTLKENETHNAALQKKSMDTERALERKEEELITLEAHAQKLEKDIHNIKDSWSYSLGFMATAPARLVYNMIQKSFLFKIVKIAIASPFQFFKLFTFEKLRVLRRALKYERKETILKNFKKYLNPNQKYPFVVAPNITDNPTAEESSLPKKTAEQAFIYNLENVTWQESSIYLKGWVCHPAGIKHLEVLSNDKLLQRLEHGKARADVHKIYPNIEGSMNAGFEEQINISGPDANLLLRIHANSSDALDIELQKTIDTKRAMSSNAWAASKVIERIRFYQKGHSEFHRPFKQNPPLSTDVVKLIAYYLPQFHPIPENNKWWGKGFTEWANVTQGLPYFSDHYQPRLPADLGFYNLTDLEIIRQQVAMAKNYGLFGFCFHLYWFSGKRLLEKPLDLFLESDIDFPFCICWANENWTKRWDGLEQDILLKQNYTDSDPQKFVLDISKYIEDERYIRIQGRPLIIVYRPSIIPNIKKVVKQWRKEFARLGISKPFFACVQGFGLDNPYEVGFDLAIEFPPHKVAVDLSVKNENVSFYSKFEGHVYWYDDIVEAAKKFKKEKFPFIKSVFPAWDNEARRKGKGGTVFAQSTPEKYKIWLKEACGFAKANPFQGENFVFINAWNEWAEGAYLEPDRHFGHAYLQATYEALDENVQYSAIQSKEKIIVVSHDAYRHGAQFIALNIVRVLKQHFGLDVVVLLLDGGPLVEEFSKITETINIKKLLHRESLLQETLLKLYEKGFKKAICNTTVSGKIVSGLSKSGIQCVSLIHELSQLIKDYKLEKECIDIANHCYKIIFPSKAVQKGFNSFLTNPSLAKQVICPQGVYAIKFDEIGDIPKGRLRHILQLEEDDIIVAGLGYADKRKGIDLFLEVADTSTAKNPKVHFVWIGDIGGEVKESVMKQLKTLKRKDNIHLLPFQDNIHGIIVDFDFFLLTSREDPFPSVVLESLTLNVPVIAFEGGGGIVELNDYQENSIALVPYLDTAAMSEQIEILMASPDLESIKRQGQRLMFEKFQYDTYCFNLLNAFENVHCKKISVVVPNYNYAHCMKERLHTIWEQTYPIFEVIVLDDKSTDNSLKTIEELCHKQKRKIRLFPNEQNSGSVFKQWYKGVAEARGDFVWIAEADDLSEPTFLATLIEFFEQQSSIGLAYAQSKQINEEGTFIAKDYLYYTDELDTIKWRKDYINNGTYEIKNALSVRNTILNVSSVLWKKSVLRKVLNRNLEDILKLKLTGDWLIYIKALEQSDIAFSSDSLNIHRRHSESVTHKLNAEQHVNEIRFIHDYLANNHSIDKDTMEIMEKERERVNKYLTT